MADDPLPRWASVPLAERMRPRSFDEFLGQAALAGPDGVLRRAAEAGSLRSLVLWGPPGSGKTALARLLARAAGLPFAGLSAVTSGVKDVRAVIAQAQARRRPDGTPAGMVLFLDEIHRFNQAQQDALLPHVEDGTLVLIGSTTENPSFEVNAPLLSRLQVYTLEPLDRGVLAVLLDRALADAERGFGRLAVELGSDAREFLITFADGDGRTLLNALEIGLLAARGRGHGAAPIAITRPGLEAALQKRILRHDKRGEAHHDTVSAFIKSLRASDPDAACYWLGRLIAAGEDPRFIVRRLVILASEDVGNADPQGLAVAVAAQQAVHFVGMPEASYALYQAATYLATAPKSNATLRAMGAVKKLLERGTPPVPLHLRNAPTSLMKKLGYGRGYLYPHDAPGHIVPQGCLPAGLEAARIYVPSVYGFERQIRERMAYWEKLRRAAREAARQEGEA